MPTQHTVVQGETVFSIAKAAGFRDWRVVWDDPANADLKSKRANAGILNPGDVLTLPDLAGKTVDCTTNKTYRFKVKAPQAFFSTLLKDMHGQPYKKTKYRLTIDDTKTADGTTDDRGYLLESVPPDAKTAQVTVFVTVRGSAGRTREAEVAYPKVQLGVLDPIDTDSGVKGRLAALGYHCPLEGDLAEEACRKAVRAFQADHDLTVTGDVDQTTRGAIRDAYDTR